VFSAARGVAFRSALSRADVHKVLPTYLRLIDSCINQLKAQGPSRTCNESKEEEEEQQGTTFARYYLPSALRSAAPTPTRCQHHAFLCARYPCIPRFLMCEVPL